MYHCINDKNFIGESAETKRDERVKSKKDTRRQMWYILIVRRAITNANDRINGHICTNAYLSSTVAISYFSSFFNFMIRVLAVISQIAVRRRNYAHKKFEETRLTSHFPDFAVTFRIRVRLCVRACENVYAVLSQDF